MKILRDTIIVMLISVVGISGVSVGILVVKLFYLSFNAGIIVLIVLICTFTGIATALYLFFKWDKHKQLENKDNNED